MPDLISLYNNTVNKLTKAGIDDREARTDAGLLMEFVFGCDRGYIYGHGDEEVSDEEKLSRFSELTDKRAKRLPLQHLTNEQSFMGLDLYVDENVLIPRQDTEFLVEEAMIGISDGMKVLDLCTGSGCILISLMKYKNGIEGYASDISDAALQVCRINAERHGLIDNITLIKSDLFDSIPADETFDAILSNPPYIRTTVIKDLSPEVRDHDPYIALDGHEDGLYFYRRIAVEAFKHLKLSGLLYLEIGYDQAESVTELLKEAGFCDVTVTKDYSGHDRVVSARRPIPDRS
jgi:release factor glutamine methyltransferase